MGQVKSQVEQLHSNSSSSGILEACQEFGGKIEEDDLECNYSTCQ